MNRQAFQHPSGNGMRSVISDLTMKSPGVLEKPTIVLLDQVIQSSVFCLAVFCLSRRLAGFIFQALCILAGVAPWSVTAGPADNA